VLDLPNQFFQQSVIGHLIVGCRHDDPGSDLANRSPL
jgi:hypothetical protein